MQYIDGRMHLPRESAGKFQWGTRSYKQMPSTDLRYAPIVLGFETAAGRARAPRPAPMIVERRMYRKPGYPIHLRIDFGG